MDINKRSFKLGIFVWLFIFSSLNYAFARQDTAVINIRGNEYVDHIGQLRHMEPSPLTHTGVYVNKGDLFDVHVELKGSNLTKLPELFISKPGGISHQNNVPRLKINDGYNRISAPVDGIVYIFHQPSIGDEIDFDIYIDGGSKFPKFVLGTDTYEDWQNMLNEFSDANYIELVGEKTMFTVTKDIALSALKNKNPEDILKGWDKIVSYAKEQYGLKEKDISKRFHFVDGFELGSQCRGYMNASHWRIMACYDSAKRYFETSKEGDKTILSSWGPWHELGHHMQISAMTWKDMTEVTVNLTSLFIERAQGATSSRLAKERRWAGIMGYLYSNNKVYDDIKDPFVKLGMLWQLDLTFGEDFYKRLAAKYRSNNVEYLYKWQNNYGELHEYSNETKKQEFIFLTSKVSGFNLIPFFEEWGLYPQESTRDRVKKLNLKQLDSPIWLNRDDGASGGVLYRLELDPIVIKSAFIDASYSDNVDLISNLLDVNDELLLTFYNGHWNKKVVIPAATYRNKGKKLMIARDSTWSFDVHINNQIVTLDNYSTKYYISNGNSWVEVNYDDRSSSGRYFIRKRELAGTPTGDKKLFSKIYEFKNEIYLNMSSEWSSDVYLPDASQDNVGNEFHVRNIYMTNVHANGEVFYIGYGNPIGMLSLISNGEKWLPIN